MGESRLSDEMGVSKLTRSDGELSMRWRLASTKNHPLRARQHGDQLGATRPRGNEIMDEHEPLDKEPNNRCDGLPLPEDR